MAWTAVPTFTSGQILTASQMNGLGSDLTQLRGDYARSTYTAANININSTTWTNLGGPADLVLAASTGDLIEVTASLFQDNAATNIFYDVVTMVSGSPVTSFGIAAAPDNTSSGILAWGVEGSIYQRTGGNFFYTLAAGDISSSTVTLRLRVRTSSATTRVVYASAGAPLTFFARNHGPVEI